MSSMHAHHDCPDVTRAMPFEINPAFFPPPMIAIPKEDIKPPSEFKYDFSRENEAVARYSKEQVAAADVAGTIDILSKMAYLSLSSKTKQKSNQSTSNNNKNATPPSSPTTLLPTWKPPSLL